MFRAFTSVTGVELFISDGTSTGTTLLKDIRSGTSNSFPSGLVVCGNTLYFAAGDTRNGIELWKSDLTTAGTVMVKDIHAGSSGSFPLNLTCCDGRLFFTATAAGTGRELHVTDGTTAGTHLVRDLHNGTNSSSPMNLTCAGAGVFFSASVSGRTGLYFSDGTASGTGIYCDLTKGAPSNSPSQFAICNGQLFFVADDGLLGSEVYRFTDWTGTVEHVGEGCGTNKAVLDATNPIINTSISINGSWAPIAPGLLVTGPPAAPFNMLPLLSPECALFVSPLLFEIVPQPGGTNWRLSALMPNDKGLIGAKLMLQSLYGMPAELSNAVLLAIGTK